MIRDTYYKWPMNAGYETWFWSKTLPRINPWVPQRQSPPAATPLWFWTLHPPLENRALGDLYQRDRVQGWLQQWQTGLEQLQTEKVNHTKVAVFHQPRKGKEQLLIWCNIWYRVNVFVNKTSRINASLWAWAYTYWMQQELFLVLFNKRSIKS